MVDFTYKGGPLEGTVQPGVTVLADPTHYEPIHSLRLADLADGDLKVFTYHRDPVENRFWLAGVVPIEDADDQSPLEPASGSPPSPTAPEPPVVAPNFGWTQAYGKTVSCINSALLAEISFDGTNDRIMFKLTTPASPNGTRVIHALGIGRKADGCPNDPLLVNMGAGSKFSQTQIGPAFAVLTAERYHPISGFQGRNWHFYSQWIVTAGPDIGFSHAVQGVLH